MRWVDRFKKFKKKEGKRTFLLIYLLFSLDDIIICTLAIVLLNHFIILPWWGGLLIAATILTKLIAFFPQAKKAYLQKPLAGSESLVGEKGKVIEDLDPVGQVRSKGSIWQAKSIRGTFRQGEKIEIVDTEGLTLLVKRPTKRY